MACHQHRRAAASLFKAVDSPGGQRPRAAVGWNRLVSFIPMTTYRFEHQSPDGTTTILGRTDAPAAGQAELSARAMQLIREGARGELVLVDEATGEEVARRALQLEPDSDQGQLPPLSSG